MNTKTDIFLAWCPPRMGEAWCTCWFSRRILPNYDDGVYELDNQPGTWEKLEWRGDVYMEKFVCDLCGYVYDPAEGDPDNGIDPGTSFSDLPDDWVCPLCGASKDDFSPLE